MPPRARRLTLLAVLAVLALAPPAGAAPADDSAPPMPFALRDTQAVRLAIHDLRRLLDEGRTTAALVVAQRILDEHPQDLYRRETGATFTRWRPAAEEVRDLLAGLPARGAGGLRADGAPVRGAGGRRRPGPPRRGSARRGGRPLRGEPEGIDGRPPPRVTSPWRTGGGTTRRRPPGRRCGSRPPTRGCGAFGSTRLGVAGDAAALAALAPPEALVLPPAGGARAAHRAARRSAPGAPASPLPLRPRAAGRGAGTRRARSRSRPRVPGPSACAGRTPSTFPWGASTSTETARSSSGGASTREERFASAREAFRPIHPAVAGRVAYLADGRTVTALDLFSGVTLWLFARGDATALERQMMTPGGPGAGRTTWSARSRRRSPGTWCSPTWRCATPTTARLLQRGRDLDVPAPAGARGPRPRGPGALAGGWGRSPRTPLRARGHHRGVARCAVAEGIVTCVAARFEGIHHVLLLGLRRGDRAAALAALARAGPAGAEPVRAPR